VRDWLSLGDYTQAIDVIFGSITDTYNIGGLEEYRYHQDC
jgi:dTDP-D-glucose 4,6-dehydratase